MALEVHRLKRALFGYRTTAVDEILTQRDDQFHTVVTERNVLSERLDEASRSLLDARREVAEAEANAATTAELMADLEIKLGSANERVSALEGEVAGLESRLADEASRAGTAERRLRDVEDELRRQRERAESVGAELAEAQERAAGLDAIVQERTQDLAGMRDAFDGVRTELDRAHADARSARGDADASARALEGAESTIAELRADVQGLGRRVEELVRERDAARSESQRAHAERAAHEASELRDALQVQGDTVGREETSVGAGDVVAALAIAERAMERIVNENRRRIDEEISQLERRRDEVRDDVARLEERAGHLRDAGWRVGEAVRETRDAIGTVDEAIRTALQPLIGSLSVLDEGIAILDVEDLEGGDQDGSDDSDTGPRSVVDEPTVLWHRAHEGRAG